MGPRQPALAKRDVASELRAVEHPGIGGAAERLHVEHVEEVRVRLREARVDEVEEGPRILGLPVGDGRVEAGLAELPLEVGRVDLERARRAEDHELWRFGEPVDQPSLDRPVGRDERREEARAELAPWIDDNVEGEDCEQERRRGDERADDEAPGFAGDMLEQRAAELPRNRLEVGDIVGDLPERTGVGRRRRSRDAHPRKRMPQTG